MAWSTRLSVVALVSLSPSLASTPAASADCAIGGDGFSRFGVCIVPLATAWQTPDRTDGRKPAKDHKKAAGSEAKSSIGFQPVRFSKKHHKGIHMTGTLNLTGYTLTFDDEFDNFSAAAGSTDLSKPLNATWQTQFFWGARYFGSNGEQQYYSDSTTGTNPFSLQNGALDITAAPGSNPAGQPYNSGMINSYHSFSQTYGYFEMRAKLPEGQGMWPAFWLLPENGGTGEIDAMEAFGAKAADGEGGSNQVDRKSVV